MKVLSDILDLLKNPIVLQEAVPQGEEEKESLMNRFCCEFHAYQWEQIVGDKTNKEIAVALVKEGKNIETLGQEDMKISEDTQRIMQDMSQIYKYHVDLWKQESHNSVELNQTSDSSTIKGSNNNKDRSWGVSSKSVVATTSSVIMKTHRKGTSTLSTSTPFIYFIDFLYFICRHSSN